MWSGHLHVPSLGLTETGMEEFSAFDEVVHMPELPRKLRLYMTVWLCIFYSSLFLLIRLISAVIYINDKKFACSIHFCVYHDTLLSIHL
jgi:hypothetical protein